MYDWQFDFLDDEINRHFESFWNANFGIQNNPMDVLTNLKDNVNYPIRIRQGVAKTSFALSHSLSPYIWRDFAQVKDSNISFVDHLTSVVDNPDKPSSKTLSVSFESFLGQLKNKEVADHLKEIVRIYFKKTPLKVYRLDLRNLSSMESVRMQKRGLLPTETLETLIPLKTSFNMVVSIPDADQRTSFGTDEWEIFFSSREKYNNHTHVISPEADSMLRSVASSWAMGALYPIDFTDDHLTFMAPSEPYINAELYEAISDSPSEWQDRFYKSYAQAVNESRLKTINAAVFNTQAQISQLIERKFLIGIFSRLLSKTVTIATDKIETMREEVNQAYNTSAGGFGWH